MTATTRNQPENFLAVLKDKAAGPGDGVVAVGAIIDLLLDMRKDSEDLGLAAEIDAILSDIGKRPGMLLVREVQAIHERLGGQ